MISNQLANNYLCLPQEIFVGMDQPVLLSYVQESASSWLPTLRVSCIDRILLILYICMDEQNVQGQEKIFYYRMIKIERLPRWERTAKRIDVLQ